MRKMLILLTLTVLTVANIGCSHCRGLFRRGAPCGGTRMAAPPMLGGAIPLGNPIAIQQQPQFVAPTIVTQPNCCCEQAPPVCCEPCPTQCVPCESGYFSGDCPCPTNPGEYFGGYLEDSAPSTTGGAIQSGSENYPAPVPGT